MRYLSFGLLWIRLAWMRAGEALRGCRSEFVFQGRTLSMTQVAWEVSKAQWP